MFFSFGACLAHAERGIHSSRLGDVLAAITERLFPQGRQGSMAVYIVCVEKSKSQDVTGIQYPLWPHRDPLSRTRGFRKPRSAGRVVWGRKPFQWQSNEALSSPEKDRATDSNRLHPSSPRPDASHSSVSGGM